MAPKLDRLALIFGMVAKLFAKATTKLGLATTSAALWLIALPIASAVAQGAPGQISAARAAALLRLWIVLRLWMSGFQLLGTLRNKLLCTLGRLRQQLRHGLRACEIRLRRTVRTDFLLRVPAAPRVGEIGRSTRKQSPSPW